MFKFDEKKHQYTLDKKIIPSVTTIISQYFNTYGDMTEEERNTFLPIAAKKGSEVHNYIEGTLLKAQVNVKNHSYLDAYERFMKEYPSIKFLKKEFKSFNRNFGYAGTIDAIIQDEDSGVFALLDWKTSVEVHLKEYGAQLYAYSLMDQVPKIEKAFIVHLMKNGLYKVYDLDLEEGRKNWELAYNSYIEKEKEKETLSYYKNLYQKIQEKEIEIKELKKELEGTAKSPTPFSNFKNYVKDNNISEIAKDGFKFNLSVSKRTDYQGILNQLVVDNKLSNKDYNEMIENFKTEVKTIKIELI